MEMIKRIGCRAFFRIQKEFFMFMLKKILIFILFFIGLQYQSTVIKVDEVNGIIMNWWFLWSFLLLIEILWNSRKSTYKRLGGALDN